MMQISRDDVLKLASLSSLQLVDEEIEGLQSDLETILQYVEQLDELDTEGITPAYQVTGLVNVYRDDIVDAGGIDRDTMLSLAPETKDYQVKVPKVL